MKRRRLTLAEDLLSVFDVAELVGRSVSTVYDWHKQGSSPPRSNSAAGTADGPRLTSLNGPKQK